MSDNCSTPEGCRGDIGSQALRMTMVIPSDTNYLQFLSTISKEFYCQAFGDHPEVDDQFYFNMELVMTEAVVNAIKHAYKGSAGPVELDLQWEERRLTMRVVNYGITFDDFDAYAAREIDELDPLSTSGRGIIIIRTLMDRLSYTSDPETGRNVMEMCKSFSKTAE